MRGICGKAWLLARGRRAGRARQGSNSVDSWEPLHPSDGVAAYTAAVRCPSEDRQTMANPVNADPVATARFTPEHFYRAFAISVLSWQHIEHSLFALLFALSSTRDLDVIGGTYHREDSFAKKLALVNDAAKAALDAMTLSAACGSAFDPVAVDIVSQHGRRDAGGTDAFPSLSPDCSGPIVFAKDPPGLVDSRCLRESDCRRLKWKHLSF